MRQRDVAHVGRARRLVGRLAEVGEAAAELLGVARGRWPRDLGVVRPSPRTAGDVRSTSSVAAVASAPASKQRATRGSSVVQLGQRRARGMYHLPIVCAGTMFGASPPCVTMPWTRSRRRMCWRSRPIAACATVSASAALTPSSGNAEACASLPCSGRRTCATAMTGMRPSSIGAGWTIIAACDAVEGAALEHAGSCRRRPPRPACR